MSNVNLAISTFIRILTTNQDELIPRRVIRVSGDDAATLESWSPVTASTRASAHVATPCGTTNAAEATDAADAA